MTATVETAGRDLRVISLIGAGHFMSHFYMLILPPLFPVLKAELGVGYAALGLLATAFAVVSGVTQIPVGFLVDRLGARPILIAGLVIGSAAVIAMGLTGSYYALLVFAAVAGLANSVYHPADYAIISANIDERRIGRAFSLHTFCGYAGNAAAPLTILAAHQMWGWQNALIGAGCVGLCVALAMLLNADALDSNNARSAARAEPGSAPAPAPAPAGARLLLSPPILMCFLFFVMLAMSSSGLSNFAVAAFVAVFEMPLTDASAALTAFLVGGTLGILLGGIIADRTTRHASVAMVGFGTTAVLILLVGNIAMPLLLLIAVLAVAGVLHGMIMPSRDMLVRAVTPPGSMGKVFGFVSTGLNVGSAVTPAIFGWIMDRGDPQIVFWLAALFMLGALGTVVGAKATR